MALEFIADLEFIKEKSKSILFWVFIASVLFESLSRIVSHADSVSISITENKDSYEKLWEMYHRETLSSNLIVWDK